MVGKRRKRHEFQNFHGAVAYRAFLFAGGPAREKRTIEAFADLAQRCQHVLKPHGGHPAANVDPALIGDDEYDGLVGRTSQVNGLCLAAEAKALELAVLRMTLDMQQAAEEEEGEKKDGEDEDENKKEDEKTEEDEKKEEDKEQMLDGIPERFIGPLLAELVVCVTRR